MGKVQTLFGEIDEPEPRKAAVASNEDFYFVLNDERLPVAVSEEEWEAAPKEHWLVASSSVSNDYVKITTSFEGVNDVYSDEPGPLLFSTYTLINGVDGMYEGAYRTWSEAEAGHAEVVARYEARYGATG